LASSGDNLHDAAFGESNDSKAQTVPVASQTVASAAPAPAADNRPSFTTVGSGAQSILSMEQLQELRTRLGVVLSKPASSAAAVAS